MPPDTIFIPADPVESKPEGSYAVKIALGSWHIDQADAGISGYLYAANARLRKGETSEVFGLLAKMSWISSAGAEKQTEWTEKASHIKAPIYWQLVRRNVGINIGVDFVLQFEVLRAPFHISRETASLIEISNH
jgi:hypothetical protein